LAFHGYEKDRLIFQHSFVCFHDKKSRMGYENKNQQHGIALQKMERVCCFLQDEDRITPKFCKRRVCRRPACGRQVQGGKGADVV